MAKVIALFFPAFISISVYARRKSIELVPDLKLLVRYGIYVMLLNWLGMSLITYIFHIEDCVMETMESWGFLTKYIFITAFLAFLIPYIEEIIQKSICISFTVEERKGANNEDHQNS